MAWKKWDLVKRCFNIDSWIYSDKGEDALELRESNLEGINDEIDSFLLGEWRIHEFQESDFKAFFLSDDSNKKKFLIRVPNNILSSMTKEQGDKYAKSLLSEFIEFITAP